MRGLPVLGEIGAPVAADGRPWGLRRLDLQALGAVRERVGKRRVVLVTGPLEAEVALAVDDDDEARPAPSASPTEGADPPAVGSAAALAVGLAATAAAAGTRTVLVECDVERPRLAAALGLEPVPGLHEYLRWEANPQEVLQTLVPTGDAAGADAPPLACVPAGRPSDSPRTLLGLGSFRHMTARLRDAYELTVLLGPPLEGVGGALDPVAAESDCSIAALTRRPDRRAAKAIREDLSRLQAPPVGGVVVTPA